MFAHACLVLECAAGSAAIHVAFCIVRARAAGVGGALLVAAAGGVGAGEAVGEARHVGERAHRAARALDLADESGGSAEAAGGACNAAGGGEVAGGAQSQKVNSVGVYAAHSPPAKIATPTFGSDVAARYDRPTLRFAVLHVRDVTLKMSTALEVTLPLPATAQVMRLAHAITKPTTAHSTIPSPNQHNTPRTDTKINIATRTFATSEDRNPDIRQRCGCKI